MGGCTKGREGLPLLLNLTQRPPSFTFSRPHCSFFMILL